MEKIINYPTCGSTVSNVSKMTESSVQFDLSGLDCRGLKDNYTTEIRDHIWLNDEFMNRVSLLEDMGHSDEDNEEEMKELAYNLAAYLDSRFGVFSTDYYYIDDTLVVEISGEYEGSPFGYEDKDIPIEWRSYPYLTEYDYNIVSDVKRVSNFTICTILNYGAYSEDIHNAMKNDDHYEVILDGEMDYGCGYLPNSVKVECIGGKLYFENIEEEEED